MTVADWGRFDMWHLSASPSCDFTSLFHTLRSDGASFLLRAEMLLTCGCLFGWKLTNFPFFFSPPFHSTLSLAFPLSSIAVIDNHMWSCHVQVFVCGCLLLLLLLLFVILPFILFAPSLKHPPLVCSSVLFLSTGEFSSSLPPLFLVYQPPPPPSPSPPPLPACCFPKEVNLLSAGSMNSSGFELRPTHPSTQLTSYACRRVFSCCSATTRSSFSRLFSENYKPCHVFNDALSADCQSFLE